MILWKNKIPTRRFVHKQTKDGAINSYSTKIQRQWDVRLPSEPFFRPYLVVQNLFFFLIWLLNLIFRYCDPIFKGTAETNTYPPYTARRFEKCRSLCRSHILALKTFILHGKLNGVSTSCENVPFEGETFDLFQCFDTRTIRTTKEEKHGVIYEGKGGTTG